MWSLEGGERVSKRDGSGERLRRKRDGETIMQH